MVRVYVESYGCTRNKADGGEIMELFCLGLAMS